MANWTMKFLLVRVTLLASGIVLPARGAEESSVEQLFEAGKALFDQYAPEEIKAEYEFPSQAQWDDFAARLQRALESSDISELKLQEDEARGALLALRALPGYEDYADWLEERIDYIEAAKDVPVTPAPEPVPSIEPKPKPPVRAGPPPPEYLVPHYDLWLERMQSRPLPSRAHNLMPTLRSVFAAEGVPPELAWIAETESTLNPSARSPVGAKGLFQLMPETAKSLGLSTFLPDERTDVKKSAQAAARYLRMLHGKFGDWPLALAAYNAGEGRVRKLLKRKNAGTFAEIASSLPAETRMYVPKVCATVAVRAGVPPQNIPAPRAG